MTGIQQWGRRAGLGRGGLRVGVCLLGLSIVAAAAGASVFASTRRPMPEPVRRTAAPHGTREAHGRLRPVAQVFRSEQADITFELRPLENGGVQVVGRRGRLAVTKNVQATGEFDIEFSTGRDTVKLAVSANATRVTRGRTTVELPRGTPAETSAMQVRRLLADSIAVAQFRAVAAALLENEDSSPAATAFLMADAAVGSLTGDVGAPRRVAQHLARRARRAVRPVGMAADCFAVMEQKMMFASNDYNDCWVSTMYNSFYQSLCSYRWLLQVESYWFSFISCSGFNWQ